MNHKCAPDKVLRTSSPVLMRAYMAPAALDAGSRDQCAGFWDSMGPKIEPIGGPSTSVMRPWRRRTSADRS